MYGDTTAIRRLAARMTEQADVLRDLAARLVRGAHDTPWQGRAAEAMRASVSTHGAQLREVAERHDAASAALCAHAEAVDRVCSAISAAEAAFGDLMHGARERLSLAWQTVGALVDPLDRIVDALVPPPPGSREWLDVRLPGLPGPPDLTDLLARTAT